MKKLTAIFMAVILALSVSVIAFANGGFIASPSGNKAPEIIEIIYEDGSCKPEIVVTPYAERYKLDEKRRTDLEAGYNEIAANKDLTKICYALASFAKSKKIDALSLAVSDLFDVSAYHKDTAHDYCGKITIKLSAETLKNFAALIHRDPVTGKWEHIADAVYDSETNTVTFTVKNLSPFAVVVDTKASTIPETGELPLQIIIPAAIVMVSAVSLAGVLVVLKKKKQEA